MSNPTVKKAIELVKEQRYFDSIQGLMSWDLWAGLSKEGQPYRGEVSGYFTRQALSLLTSSDTAKLVDELKQLDDSAFADIYEKAAVNALIDRYTKAVMIPPELQIKLRNFTGEAQRAWQDSIKMDSFENYKPWLKGLFDLKLQIAEAINPNANPFDVLCDTVDKGIDTAEVGRMFGELKKGIGEILNEIKDEHAAIDDSKIRIPCDVKRIRDMAYDVNALTGYNYDCGRDSETVHGMCTSIGPKDTRIAISYRGDPWAGMFTMLHEGGHGRYGHNSHPRAIECGVWGGVRGAMHEGQARFYENMVGRSFEFIKYAYPTILKHFPEIKDVPVEDFYKMVNKVTPGLVRMGSDELTYSLHPIIRFEIEKDFFDGKIKTDDFEEVWNAKYQECFGMTPKNVKEGVLQDIHWASGHVGYFQSYTLGNLYCGQLLNSMLKVHPDLYAKMEKGNFDPVNSYLYEHIHQYGSNAYTPKELIVNATGEQLNEKYFLEYLRRKYLGK